MSLDPLHVTYRLSRGQQWAAHLGVWLHYWPGCVLVVASLVGVPALSHWVSRWFLLLLLVPLPPFSNIPRLVVGFVRPLLYGGWTWDIIIEQDRLGYSTGSGHRWIPRPP